MSQVLAHVKYFIISCSADADALDARNLYAWGEWQNCHSLPDTRREAMRRIGMCKKKHQCQVCDAQIHEQVLERTQPTKAQE